MLWRFPAFQRLVPTNQKRTSEMCYNQSNRATRLPRPIYFTRQKALMTFRVAHDPLARSAVQNKNPVKQHNSPSRKEDRKRFVAIGSVSS